MRAKSRGSAAVSKLRNRSRKRAPEEHSSRSSPATDAIQAHAELMSIFGQAVIATDANGRIVFWNESAEEMYGWKRAEVLGRPVIDVTPSDLNREQAQEILARLSAGDAWSGEFEVQSRDGTSFRAWVTDLPVLSEEGTLVGVVGLSALDSKDIVARRRIAAAEWLRDVREKVSAALARDITFEIHGDERVAVEANRLELDQIIGSILQLLWDACGRDCGIEISCSKSARKTLRDFGLVAQPDMLVHIVVAPRTDGSHEVRPGTALSSLRRSSAAARLVARASGFLFVRSDATSPVTLNLFLPAAK